MYNLNTQNFRGTQKIIYLSFFIFYFLFFLEVGTCKKKKKKIQSLSIGKGTRIIYLNLDLDWFAVLKHRFLQSWERGIWLGSKTSLLRQITQCFDQDFFMWVPWFLMERKNEEFSFPFNCNWPIHVLPKII